jgi:hypothetical protein
MAGSSADPDARSGANEASIVTINSFINETIQALI